MLVEPNKQSDDGARVGSRLTSLTPFDPDNKPDAWERSALEAFERGEKEVVSINKVGDRHYVQLMRPLVTEQACLECHAEGGDKVGDIRGGIHVAVPVPTLQEALGNEVLRRGVGYGSLWLLGLVGLVVGGRRLGRQIGHCRHVEEALVDTLELAQETAMNMPGVAYQFRLRPDGTYWFPYISEGVTKMLGVTPREVREDPVGFFPGMLFEEDVDAIFASIDESVEHLSNWQRELCVKLADGQIKWVRASSTPHVMPDKTVLFDGIFVDITEHKEMDQKLEEANALLERRVTERTNELAEANRELEEEVAERRRAEMWLLQSEQRFRSYFEQGLVGMAILSPEKEWEEVNARLCEILGYSEEELLATSWTELTHPDERADDEAQFDRIGSGIQGVFSVDRRLLHKDGRTVFVTLSVKCLCDVDGKIDCLVVLVQDITQRKRALENLQAEKNLSEAMFNSMPGIFCAFDPSGRFLRWNKQFEKVTGYSPEEILGMDPVDFFPPADRQWVKEEIREVLQRGWGTMEAEFLTKDGTRLPYSFSGVRYEIAGHPCMLGTGVNISDRKRAEKERESLIAALEGKNAEMERFVYTVSHDLKSPLVTIQGFLGLSEQDIEDGDLPRLRADLARIHDAADKMRRLLDELLELSRIGHTGDSPQEVAVDALVHEALELVAGRIAQCDIEVHVAPNLPVLYGQHSRLREVLQNLIDNAAKYMGNQPNPRIEIGSRHEEGEPVIYVRDNGIGIDPHHSDKVFGLFTKLDRESEGAGVGLALVKRIIETHEGRVWVESDGVDRGASFCFTVGLQGPTTKHHVNGMSTQQSNSTVVVRSAN